jgi:hypothetical protein
MLTQCAATQRRRAISTLFDGRGAAPFRFAVHLRHATPAAPHLHPAIDGKIKGAGTIGRQSIKKSMRAAGAQISSRAGFSAKASKFKTRSGTVRSSCPDSPKIARRVVRFGHSIVGCARP